MNPLLSSKEQPISGGEAGAKTALPGWILFMEKAVGKFQPMTLPFTQRGECEIDMETGSYRIENDYEPLRVFYQWHRAN